MAAVKDITFRAPRLSDVFIVQTLPEGLALQNSLVGLTWTESAQAASVEATLTFKQDEVAQIVGPGQWLTVKAPVPPEGRYKYVMPHLYVWDKGTTDNLRNTVTFEALDVASFLQRVGKRTWVFKAGKGHKKGWTASEIAEFILEQMVFPHKVVKTEHRIPFIRVHGTPLEMITTAYTEDRIATGRKYRLRAIRRTFVAELLRPQRKTWYVSEGTNLRSSSWTETLDGLATEVRAVSLGDNNIPTQAAKAKIPAREERYGRITETIEYDKTNVVSPKRLKELAVARVRKTARPKRTVSITTQGIPGLRASDALLVVDSGTKLKGLFFVDSVTHSVSPGNYGMTLELGYSVKIPARRASEEELTEVIEPPPEPELPDDVVTYGPDGKPLVNNMPIADTSPAGGPPVGARGQALAQVIDRFINRQRNPPMAGMGIDFVHIGNVEGVSPIFLACIAAKETQFGLTAGSRINNAFGWGNYNFSSWQEGIQTVARGLRKPTGGYYYTEGRFTIESIIPRYAPASDGNDVPLYISQVRDWTRAMGGDPNQRVFAAPGSWA